MQIIQLPYDKFMAYNHLKMFGPKTMERETGDILFSAEGEEKRDGCQAGTRGRDIGSQEGREGVAAGKEEGEVTVGKRDSQGGMWGSDHGR